MRIIHWLLLNLLFTVATFACTEKTIVYKPSGELDPLPSLAPPDPAIAADPLRDQQWSLDQIGVKNLPEAGNANLVIAVLSTGIDYSHEDLLNRVHINIREITPQGPDSPLWTNRVDDDGNGLVDDVIGYDVIANDGFAFDRHGVGTALAGVLAARRNNGLGIAGLLADCRLYPIRYVGDDGQTTVYHLIRALEIAAQAKPNIILLHLGQMNLGGRFGDAAVTDIELRVLRERLTKLQTLQIPIVVGAGNSNQVFGSRPFEALLGSFPNVAVVTSSTSNDQLQFLANYSHQYVLTSAPGNDIFTTGLGNSYQKKSSTALAAAHVTAAMAMVLAKNGNVSVDRLFAALTKPEASDVIPALQLASLGQNRLNVAKYIGAF